MKAFFVLMVGMAVLVLAPACSSEADAFEECDLPGGTRDVCEPGSVCGKPTDNSAGLACLPICDDDKQCPSNNECKGVSGSNLKGCRFKD